MYSESYRFYQIRI